MKSIESSPIVLLTDIPDWNEPLVSELRRLDVSVSVVTQPGDVPPAGILVNRVSAASAAQDPAFAADVESLLDEQRRLGRTIINGAHCHRLGYDKMAQAELFERCGVRTPRTRLVDATERRLPDLDALLKPRVGSYGQGIVRVGPGERMPDTLAESVRGYVEQEYIRPVDGLVHRIEILGEECLYEAVTPLIEEMFNYCLASGVADTAIVFEPGSIGSAQALRVARHAGMQIGSLEFLVGEDHVPFFIDLNPVSSFHPAAGQKLGFDPTERLGQWLCIKTHLHPVRNTPPPELFGPSESTGSHRSG